MSALKQTWDKNKSQVFSIIKSEYESGAELHKIASRLNSMGLKSKNNREFNKSIVCAIALYELKLEKRVEQSKHVFKKNTGVQQGCISEIKENDEIVQSVYTDVQEKIQQTLPTTLFHFENLDIRTLTKEDGSIWFVGVDVCKAIDIQNSSQAFSRLEEDEVYNLYLTDSLGRNQNTTIISESGLYSLILTSNKPEAKQFKRWITGEVIPSIRKTGSYSIQKPKELSKIEWIQIALKTEEEKVKLQEEKERAEKIAQENKQQRLIVEKKNEELKADNQNLQSRAVLFDAFTSTTELKSLKQIGYKLKRYGLGGRKIFQLLRDEKILTKVNGENYPAANYDKYFSIDTVIKTWIEKLTGKEKSRAFDVLKVTKEFYPILGSLLIKKGYLQLSDWQLIDFNNCPKDSEIFDDTF